jgi:hypothetical protein
MRFSGSVGWATSTETDTGSGVWIDVITESPYFGDVVRNARRLDPPSLVPPEVNNNITLQNQFSIMADALAYAKYTDFRYVLWQGIRWTITDVEVRRPRLILTIGGLWNGDTP